IPKDGNVSLKIFDVLGSEIYSINEFKRAGTYDFNFDGSKLASGLYFYKIGTENFNETKKMLLIK
ncbi:MAG: T9SS type A sorting domain-containing protein, partial [Ignavibacteria bacterium]